MFSVLPLFHVELEPLTTTRLLREVLFCPMIPLPSFVTKPPLVIVSEVNEPFVPTTRLPLMFALPEKVTDAESLTN